MFEALKPNGVLVTYCAQGNARRAMMTAGFTVERVNGPPGKRHMLRAIKKQ
jgi:tRNA U34 5-methylaminomethyl-2-thiouridine-forming methyltransferase MnmC